MLFTKLYFKYTGAAQKWAIVRTCFFGTALVGDMLPSAQGWRSPWRRRVQKI